MREAEASMRVAGAEATAKAEEAKKAAEDAGLRELKRLPERLWRRLRQQ